MLYRYTCTLTSGYNPNSVLSCITSSDFVLRFEAAEGCFDMNHLHLMLLWHTWLVIRRQQIRCH